MSTTTSTIAGSLTIAGSGIASVAHITLETLSHIKEADKVFYVVCDPATEAFIHDNAKAEVVDLAVYYDTNKSRYDTYVQMAEVMLRDVRAGNNVLGIFYGHPGVFVSPSHRALAIARSEGYKAKMLAGVSAEDYLFADLEFDPSIHGCATFEATELLLRDTPLNPTMNNVIWQVGLVGVENMVFNNAKFHMLADRLEKDFGPEHRVVHYIGAVLPQSATVMDTFTVADLRKEDVVKQFNPCSTLYVPPRSPATHSDAVAISLGSEPGRPFGEHTHFPPLRWSEDATRAVPTYGPHEKAVVDQLAHHQVSATHKVLVASLALKKLITELNVSATTQAKFKADPKTFSDAVEGLTEVEKLAVETGTVSAMVMVMKALPGHEQSVDMLAGQMSPQSAFPNSLANSLPNSLATFLPNSTATFYPNAATNFFPANTTANVFPANHTATFLPNSVAAFLPNSIATFLPNCIASRPQAVA